MNHAAIRCIALACLGVLFSACASAADDVDIKIRQLYVCHYFYDAGTRSQDPDLREKTRQRSAAFLLKAGAIAVDRGGEAAANALAAEARSEYVELISSWRSLGEQERGDRLDAFDTDCAAALDSKIEYQRLDRSPQQATRLYFCADVFRMLSERADAGERDSLAATSGEMKSKADTLARKSGQASAESDFAEAGRQQAAAWAAHLDRITSDSGRSKLMSKVKRTCPLSLKASP